MDNVFESLFEFLYENNLYPDRIEKRIFSLDNDEYSQFIGSLITYIPEVEKGFDEPFTFVASSKITGICPSMECRLPFIEALAKFTALYSDRVILQDLFSKYNNINEPNVLPKRSLISDLYLLFYLKPLFISGLLKFTSSKFNFPQNFYEHDFSNKTKVFTEKLIGIQNLIGKDILNYTKFYLRKLPENKALIEMQLPEDIIGHSITFLDRSLFNIIKLNNKYNYNFEIINKDGIKELPNKYNEIEFESFDLIEIDGNDFINPEIIEILNSQAGKIINDIAIHNIYSNLYGAHYVTNRDYDLRILEYINNQETNIASKKILETFFHAVPLVQNVSLDKLLFLRNYEGEAFRNYREALLIALKAVNDSSIKETKEAFNDIVRPEIVKIDLTIKNSKKLLYGSLKHDIFCATGFIAIGLFSGLLSNDIGKIIAALGGFKYISSILEKISNIFKEPPEIRDNKFYFLWKANKYPYNL